MNRIALLALAGVAAAGCVTVEPRARFAAVEQTVADRTHDHIHWSDGSTADRAITVEVDGLLAQPLSAGSAVQIALLNNRHLQATYEELGVAQADLVEAGLLRNPVFDGALRFGKGGNANPSVDLGVAFDFLDVFFIGLRKNLAAAQLDAAEARVSGGVLDLAARTRVAFVEVQAAQDTVELFAHAEQAAAASAELAKRLRDAGNNRPLDLANEQAAHEEARLALASAQADLATKRESLNRLMGVAAPQWKIDGRLPDPAADSFGDAPALEQRAIAMSLELRARRAAIVVGQRELGITRPLGWLSDLELGVSSERDDTEWEAGPALSTRLPIFSQGQPAVARAQARLRQAEQEYAATAVDVRSEVRAALARVRSLRQQIDETRATLLPLRQRIVDDTQSQFNAMQVGGFELLQARRDQLAAGRAYVQLTRDYWIARTRLQSLLDGRMLEGE